LFKNLCLFYLSKLITMKYTTSLLIALVILTVPGTICAQDESISPSIIITGKYLGETPPLRNLPTLTDADWQLMVEKAERKILNPKLHTRSYPFAETALPKGPDPVWQREMAASRDTRAPIVNFNGQDSPYYPPDANGTVGPNHYMQTINSVYAIYNKSGTLVAGPANMNTLFTGVTGATCNDGDPLVLYDEQADRWLAVEFSICGSNDYMLIAVSTTNDPTGTWHKYSFDVADMPDYEKFGVWQDGYYMGTNNSSGNDIYVFERSQMLVGGTAQAVGFNNPNRPTTIDGFVCVPPLDNDGPFAPAGEPGLFIAFNDDAIGGGSDQLWIYELDVNWTTPSSSTFSRTQQINVATFDSNFGNNWTNIKQPGTSQELDAIPQVIMNPPQYRNFGSYETIICCHTVDVDNTDHAGIRWYELRRVSSGNWTIRQQGTYAPDGNSRWMGSIMLNGSNEIGLGYSVSSTTVFPGIRYCGQSASAYAAATGNLDIAEEIIQTGAYSQTAAERWGDYSAMQVDPVDDSTFWFTTEYIGSGGARKTKIASFNFGPEILSANFSASNTNPQTNTTVVFTDLSTGSPTSWTWNITPGTYTYVGGTSASSQNPQVQFTAAGSYTVVLTVSDGVDSDSETKNNYISAMDCSNVTMPFSEDFSDGALPMCWSNVDNQGNGQVWQFNNPGSRTINTTTASNGFAILDSDHYGSGNSQNADLVSPTLNFSTFTSIYLSFQHYYYHYTGSSATLAYSTNGGSNWTTIQTWAASTANAANFSQDLSTQVAGQSNVKFKWNYTGTWGYYWAVDDISITGTGPNQWTGIASGDWSIPSNWSNGVVPSGSTAVNIPSSAPNWPSFNGDLTLGINCGNLTLSGAAQVTVTGSLTISSGNSLIFTGNGQLNIGGNWTNSGTFTPGAGTILFNGTSPANVSTYVTTTNITSYTRSTFTSGMMALSGASAGPTGDNGHQVVPIGFSFNYIGTNYTQARLSTNGWISMNESGTTSSANANLFTSTTPNTTLTPWFDNIEDDATSTVSYKTEGTAPSRTFTAEWFRVLTYNSTATARISFQVKLFETTNVIEFHYGSLETGSHHSSESASIGLEDATGGTGHFIEATTGSNTTAVTNLVSTTDWPMVNYRFIPPMAIETFHDIVVSKNGTYIDFDTNTTVDSTFTVMPGSVFNIRNGKTMTVQGTEVY
jgi:PKD repeat protein